MLLFYLGKTMIFTFDQTHMLSILNTNFSRENVRTLIPLPYKEFKKSMFSHNTSDMFGKSELMVTYNQNNFLHEVEIYPSNETKFNLFNQLIDNSFDSYKLINLLKKININYTKNESSIICKLNFTVAFYFGEIEEDTLTSILIHMRSSET